MKTVSYNQRNRGDRKPFCLGAPLGPAEYKQLARRQGRKKNSSVLPLVRREEK